MMRVIGDIFLCILTFLGFICFIPVMVLIMAGLSIYLFVEFVVWVIKTLIEEYEQNT